MAHIKVNPGETEIEATATAAIRSTPTRVWEMPGGLHPLHLSVFTMDQYLIRNGWPAAIPNHHVATHTLVSADGQVLSNRPDPTGVQTNALARWVADESHFDTTSLRWFPVQGEPDLIWEFSVESAPSLIADYEYRFESEKFIIEALNFDADLDQHMWMNMRGVFPALGYTVIMVLSPNSVYGNSNDQAYSGLWCYGEPNHLDDSGEAFFNVTLEGFDIYVETEQTKRTRSLGIAQHLNDNAPLYLALTLDRPQIRIHAASGTRISRRTHQAGNDPVQMEPSVVLGRSTGDLDHTMDMAVMDLGLYHPLTDNEVKEEFAILAETYGGER